MNQDLVLNRGVRVINGVEMMSSRDLMMVCEVKEHKEFIRVFKKLYNITEVENLHLVNITGIFIETFSEGPSIFSEILKSS